jgi:peptide-methionine (S)-S-oxide reductase
MSIAASPSSGGNFDAPLRRPGAALLILSLLTALWQTPVHAAGSATVLPPVAVDAPKPSSAGPQTIVLAGGCFWGVQLVFQHVKGVRQAISGYSGGAKETAVYEVVSSGTTGHAESVQVTFNPQRISLGRILQIYFSVAHDPTELNRQGPDTGTQYRSAIFYRDDTQKSVAEAYIAQLGKAGIFRRPIVTELNPLTEFYPAEAYHQNYGTLHPNSSYIALYDLPMAENLKRLFADLYREKPVLVSAPAPAAPLVAAPLEEGNAAYIRGDFATAERLLRPLAEQGNATAQFDLGGMYYHGRGVPQDYAAALTWYRRAADQGDARAQNGLGDMYSDGNGVPQDYAAALTWYRKSADQGHASGEYNLGAMYENGQGVPQDYADALKWFHLAADHGDVDAQFNIGGMYEHGQGVPQDYAEALKWYRVAAERGYANAQNNLGNLYAQGHGVMQDYVQAHMWFDLAATRIRASNTEGRALFIKNRDVVAAKMTAAQIADAQRLAAEWKPKAN